MPQRQIICARLADWMPLPLNLAIGLRERWQIYQAQRSSDTRMLNFTTLIAQPPSPDWQPAPEEQRTTVGNVGRKGG